MNDGNDLVVLVHGLGGKRIWMLPITWRLRRHGYRSVNWTYSSWSGTIQEHGDRLRQFLVGQLAHERRIHIVAHSLGSIVVRAAFVGDPIINVGRVVFFAPPNRGSPIACGVSRVFGTVLRTVFDVSNHSTSFVNGLPMWQDADLGVIAARFDVMIPVSSTHLATQSDHIVLNATHNTLLFSGKAIQFAANFLETGRFENVR